jgi:hypothetical protein
MGATERPRSGVWQERFRRWRNFICVAARGRSCRQRRIDAAAKGIVLEGLTQVSVEDAEQEVGVEKAQA